MKMWIYKMNGDERYIDKTQFMTPLNIEGDNEDGSFNVAMLDDTSIMTPTFVLSFKHYWRKCNYVFCQDMNRYYYVTDVTFSQNKIYVKCRIDVLMTYKDAIKEKEIIVKRSESNYNYYLTDDLYKTCASPQVRIIQFKEPSGNKFSKDNRNFVLCVVGQGDVNNGGGN